MGIPQERRDSRLIFLYKGLKSKASILTDDLIPLARHCRNAHSMAYQIPIANTNIYKAVSRGPVPDPEPLRLGVQYRRPEFPPSQFFPGKKRAGPFFPRGKN